MSVQAMKHNSVPDSLVMQSFREGLCSETSSRSRHKPKENAQNRPVPPGRFFFYGGLPYGYITGLRIARANREKVFSQILSGDITLEDVKRSRYFSNIQKRLEPFTALEMLFDKNDLIFRYNQKLQA